MKPIPIPCANLIERDGGSCLLPNHEFPTDCNDCAAYVPGINESERQRCEVWQQTDCGLKRVKNELTLE